MPTDTQKYFSFAVVCEGPTDIPIIEKILDRIGRKTHKSITKNVLHPEQDATSGRFEAWGWTNINKWCEKYSCNQSSTSTTPSNSIAYRMNMDVTKLNARFQTSHATWKSFIKLGGHRALIIVMDTDIAEEISTNRHGPIQNGTYIAFNPASTSRQAYCKKAIEHWIGTTEQQENDLIICLPTYAIETWLLSSHSYKDRPDIFASHIRDYETIPKPYEYLCKLGYASKSDGTLKKTSKHYYKYANDFYSKIYIGMWRCRELRTFVNKLIDLTK